MNTEFSKLVRYTDIVSDILENENITKGLKGIKKVDVSLQFYKQEHIKYSRENPPVPRQCYKNVFDFCCQFQNAEYILGYVLGPVPLEHCWVKIDGKYYDPTWGRVLEMMDEIGNEEIGCYGEIGSPSRNSIAQYIRQENTLPTTIAYLSNIEAFKEIK